MSSFEFFKIFFKIEFFGPQMVFIGGWDMKFNFFKKIDLK
jgi:hypothetical protein